MAGKNRSGWVPQMGNHYVVRARRTERVAESTPHAPHFVTRVTHPQRVYRSLLPEV